MVTKISPPRTKSDTRVVTTPLELISALEHDRDEIGTVVLTGRFATNQELTAFLAESYPSLQIVAGCAGDDPDPYLPAYA